MILNQILNGDSYKILPTIDDNSIDLTVTSPPYDNLRDYSDYPKLNIQDLGKELFRVTKDGGICCVVIQDQTINGAKTGTSFKWVSQWLDNTEWRLFETCIYKRHGPPGAFWKKRFRVDHEYVHIFLKGKEPRYFNKSHIMVDAESAGKMVSCDKRHKDGSTENGKKFLCPDKKCRGTIWNYASSNREGNKVKSQHPATMPDLLCSDMIRCFSQEKDTILDPFCGSGTTCVMAKNLGRNYIGIEYSKEYCDIIRKRIDNETVDIL